MTVAYAFATLIVLLGSGGLLTLARGARRSRTPKRPAGRLGPWHAMTLHAWAVVAVRWRPVDVNAAHLEHALWVRDGRPQ